MKCSIRSGNESDPFYDSGVYLVIIYILIPDIRLFRKLEGVADDFTKCVSGGNQIPAVRMIGIFDADGPSVKSEAVIGIPGPFDGTVIIGGVCVGDRAAGQNIIPAAGGNRRGGADECFAAGEIAPLPQQLKMDGIGISPSLH